LHFAFSLYVRFVRMLQASGLPRLFCDLFIEERESEREESSLSVVDSYCSILISAILCSFTV
jgi:hypothetical protein